MLLPLSPSRGREDAGGKAPGESQIIIPVPPFLCLSRSGERGGASIHIYALWRDRPVRVLPSPPPGSGAPADAGESGGKRPFPAAGIARMRARLAAGEGRPLEPAPGQTPVYSARNAEKERKNGITGGSFLGKAKKNFIFLTFLLRFSFR